MQDCAIDGTRAGCVFGVAWSLSPDPSRAILYTAQEGGRGGIHLPVCGGSMLLLLLLPLPLPLLGRACSPDAVQRGKDRLESGCTWLVLPDTAPLAATLQADGCCLTGLADETAREAGNRDSALPLASATPTAQAPVCRGLTIANTAARANFHMR